MLRHFIEIVPLALLVIIPISVQAVFFTAVFSEQQPVAGDFIKVKDSITDVKLLSADNTANSLMARGGGDIFVQDGAIMSGGSLGEDVKHDKNKAGEIFVYTVREGDTLSQIAEMFGVTSNTILWANDLASAKSIAPGESLIILPIVGVQHVVKSGDTIASIAKKYSGDAAEIRSYNQIVGDELVIGKAIMIPGGNLHVSTAKSSGSTSGGSKSTSAMVHPAPGTKKTQGLHGYNGVDFGGPIGTPVRAAAAGEVIVSKTSGWNGGYGTYVVIKHSNGSQTLYAHMSANYVGVGAVVAAGESIGAIGNTGRSTGPHLHFEVRGGRNPF